MYHCNHCHKTDNDKAGWYFDGIGGAWCQNCVFLALELLDQDPPNAKEPVATESAVRDKLDELVWGEGQGEAWSSGVVRGDGDPPPQATNTAPPFKVDMHSYTTPALPHTFTPGMQVGEQFVALNLTCDRCGADGATFYLDNPGPSGVAQTLCKACRKRWESGPEAS